MGKWTTQALHDWARELFASRDEAARMAAEAARDAVAEIRRREQELVARGTREIELVRDLIDREVAIRDKVLADLDEDMKRRLEDERGFREKVVEEALTREQYQREHRALETKHDADVKGLDTRLSNIENAVSNFQGKTAGYAVIGSIILVTASAVLTHLLGG